MCWQHLCSADRGELLEDPDRSTSELTVYLHVHRLTSGLKRGTARIMAVTGQEADERVGEECATSSFLRLQVYLVKKPAHFGPHFLVNESETRETE